MAEHELSDGEVKDRIEAIFAPYRIEFEIFEISDFDMALKYAVCDDIQKRRKPFTYSRAYVDFRMPSKLDHQLQTDRKALQLLGYEFD